MQKRPSSFSFALMSHFEVPSFPCRPPFVLLLFFPSFHFQSLGLLSSTSSAYFMPLVMLSPDELKRQAKNPSLRSEVSMLDYVSSNWGSFCFLEFVSRVTHFSTSIILTSLFRQKMTVRITPRTNRAAPRTTK